MKTALIIIGIFLVAFVTYIVSLFLRVGKPVNAALSNSYYHHKWKNKIIYSPMGNWFELGYTELDADPESFSVLSGEFAKDKQQVYWRDNVQKVEHASFTIDNGIPKDALRVYYDFGYQDSLHIIEGADPQSYEVYKLVKEWDYYTWGRDKNAVYLNGKKIDVDRATFTVLNATLATDSTNLYIIKRDYSQVGGSQAEVQVIKKAIHPGGLPHVISENYVQFGNMLVASNWKVDFSLLTFDKIEAIKIIDERNVVVNETIFVSDGERIDDVDIPSLEILNRDFIKDKQQALYDRKKITGADGASFTPVYEEYSKDKTHVFYKDQILTGANPATFTFDYATNIASDGKLRFKDGAMIE
ncbi:MAG: DKNYY domain-containing protein [Cyclobacteriaceae bacterium]|nr:DKNYY domain-containing protein [Cyclobacteriaceae bacterium]